MMKTIYQRPSKAELRKFGLVFSLFLAVIFGVLIPVFSHWGEPGLGYARIARWPAWPWFAAGTIAFWALVHPSSLFLIHRPWMKFADIASWLNSRLIMMILFYFMITPMGLFMRFFGYDPLRLKFDKSLESYRVVSLRQDRNHMKVPY